MTTRHASRKGSLSSSHLSPPFSFFIFLHRSSQPRNFSQVHPSHVAIYLSHAFHVCGSIVPFMFLLRFFFSIILSRRDATSRDETWFRLPSDFFATGEERVTHCLSYDQVWREERFIYFPEFSRNAYRVYEAVRGNRALCCASCRSLKKKRRKRTQYA